MDMYLALVMDVEMGTLALAMGVVLQMAMDMELVILILEMGMDNCK